MISALRQAVQRVLSLLRAPALDQEFDAELAAHLAFAMQENLGQGMTAEEARRVALLKLGGAQQTRETQREARGLSFIDSCRQDLRFGYRTLRRSPAFAAVAILTLALGIGANTAIFSVFYGVLLRPLPYPHPEQLVHLREMSASGGQMNFSDPNFEDLRDQSHALQALTEYNFSPQTVTVGDTSSRITVASVSSGFFRTIGVQPRQGRAFLAEEQVVNAPASALVSYSYWKQSLAGSSDFPSLHLRIGRRPISIVGVMPAGFRFPEDTDIWVPREIYERYPSRSAHNWQVIGRLADGVNIKQSRPELSAIAQRLQQQYGQDTMMADVFIESLRTSITGNVSLALVVLLIASTFFLLIACANVVNLMLAQAAARERELSLRTALGAGSNRLIRQFLTEALLLSLLGGTLGVVVAYWGLELLLAIAPKGLPRLESVSIDRTVLLFSLGIAALIAIGLGVVCAWRSTTTQTSGGLNEGNRLQGAAPRKQLLLRLMLAGQLVAAMMLLFGAGLMGRSLLRLLSVDPGFKTQNVVTMELNLPEETQMPRRVQMLDEIFARLHTIPAVETAGGATTLPLLPGFTPDGTFVVMNSSQITPATQDLIRRCIVGSFEKDPALLAEATNFFEGLMRNRDQLGQADYRVVSRDFFRTLGIPLLRGRFFEDRDAPDGQHVAVISESLARERWPKQDPLGQMIEFGNMDGDLRLLQIVGVVADLREQSLASPPRPVVYVHYRQRPRGAFAFNFVMKASGNAAPVYSAAREAVHDVDPQLAPRFSSLSQIYSNSLESRRFNLMLVAIFSATALLLAMAGIYGVNAYLVAQRTREIGVRTALGASPKQIMMLILRQGLTVGAVGVTVGALCSLALTRWMRSLLFEVNPADPITLCAVALLLMLSVLAACWIPARYAAHVDPMVALRYE